MGLFWFIFSVCIAELSILVRLGKLFLSMWSKHGSVFLVS